MPWLSVPTMVHLLHGDVSCGYLRGMGAEAGFFLFSVGSGAASRFVISDSFAPVYVVRLTDPDTGAVSETEYKLTSYNYAGNPVWATPDDSSFVFTSPSNDGSLICMDELREPFVLPLLEGEDPADQIGDSWLVLPTLAVGQTGTARAMGVNADEINSAATPPKVSMIHSLWEKTEVEDAQDDEAPWCGIYYNAAEATYKMVGSPRFRVVHGPTEFTGEAFVRSALPDENGRFHYAGSLGHSIRYDETAAVWVIGARAAGEGVVWWERSDPPIVKMGGEVSRPGSWWNRGQAFDAKTLADDQVVDADETYITVAFDCFANSQQPTNIFVAEVETWR